jgi:hypothetical protein
VAAGIVVGAGVVVVDLIGLQLLVGAAQLYLT